MRTIDVFFVGSWAHTRMKSRRKCLHWIAKISKKYNLNTVIVARSSFKQPLKFLIDLAYGLKFINYIKPGPLFGSQLAEYYRKSRFVIECPADNQLDANPMRGYEALACGTSTLFFGKSCNIPAHIFSCSDELECFFKSNYSLDDSLVKSQLLIKSNSEFLKSNSLQARTDLIGNLLFS